MIETDAALLETIIRNLVSNALKLPSTTRRHSGGALRQEQRVIDVYDTGPGLSVDRREKIFEEFSRADQRAYGVNDGLGLGLSIARRYAELLDMENPGFLLPWIGLPVHDPAAGKRRHRTNPPDRSVASAGIGRLRHAILVLDDDPLIVSALTRDLEDRGNVVFGYNSSAGAEAALDNGLVIDAAVLDFDLRGPETGLEFIRRMAGTLKSDIRASFYRAEPILRLWRCLQKPDGHG